LDSRGRSGNGWRCAATPALRGDARRARLGPYRCELYARVERSAGKKTTAAVPTASTAVPTMRDDMAPLGQDQRQAEGKDRLNRHAGKHPGSAPPAARTACPSAPFACPAVHTPKLVPNVTAIVTTVRVTRSFSTGRRSRSQAAARALPTTKPPPKPTALPRPPGQELACRRREGRGSDRRPAHNHQAAGSTIEFCAGDGGCPAVPDS
jgi:hypothetical protein